MKEIGPLMRWEIYVSRSSFLKTVVYRSLRQRQSSFLSSNSKRMTTFSDTIQNPKNGTLGCLTVSLKTNLLPPFIALTLKVIRNTLLQSKHKWWWPRTTDWGSQNSVVHVEVFTEENVSSTPVETIETQVRVKQSSVMVYISYDNITFLPVEMVETSVLLS